MKYLFALLLSAAYLLAGCGEADDATRPNDFVPLTGITISSAASKVPAGFTNQFTAKGNFSDVFTRDIITDITWESSDPGILTFDNPSSGLGRGVSFSSNPVTITATSDGVSGTFEFTVSDATLSSIAITPIAIRVAKGRTQQFVATGTFSDSSTLVITPDVAWTSSAIAVATVDTAGLATAVGNVDQNANITAALKEVISPAAVLTVGAAAVDSIQVTPNTQTILPAETQTFTATAVLSDGTTRSAVSPTWDSSNKAVATIDTSGKATSVGPGTTTITATAEGESGSATLTIATLESIVVTSPSDSVRIDGSIQMTATGKFSSGPDRDITNQVTWGPTTNDFATVSATGLVTGKQTGPVIVTATKGNVDGSKNITVTAQ